MKAAIGAVAKMLGNTPAICRKCYVHPAVLETYLDGDLIAGLKKTTEKTLENSLGDLRSEEAAVLAFLRDRLAKEIVTSRVTVKGAAEIAGLRWEKGPIIAGCHPT